MSRDDARAALSPALPRLSAQIEATFALWRASVRTTYPFALVYALAGLLPALTLGDLMARVSQLTLQAWRAALDPSAPLPELDPGVLGQALAAWLASPVTWGVIALAMLLALFGITGVILRQGDLLARRERGVAAALGATLARLPAALGAWLAYLALMLLFTLPLVALAAWFVASALQSDPAGLLVRLMVFLLGSVALSVPLAWASVAFSFAPVQATLAGTGPLAALAASARRVRGHWVRAATLVTLATLVYLGVGGALSSTALLVGAGLAYGFGGWAAVFAGTWFDLTQLALALPMAALLPLPFAAMLVCWRDLPP